MFELTGKVAVVTGGNGGIGLGIARALASAGATIVIAARNAKKSQAAVDELAQLGASAIAVTTDVTDEKSVEAMVATTAAKFGRLDILVNNAGVAVQGTVDALSLSDWRKTMETNATGAFICSKAAYPMMKKGGGGKIINLSSVLALYALPVSAAYSASKAAIIQLTRAIACCWAADNIQANAVLPGWIETDMTQYARSIPGLLDYVVKTRTPAKRAGQVDDLAGVAVFLASPASNFVTGAAITVDGGLSSHG
ncbi:MAG: SDR family NAD(P)-dependent oxidoreductase [Sulfurifustis sp.]